MRNTILCTMSLLALPLLDAAPARAADWKTSFDGKAIGTYLEGNRPAIVVVAAGQAAAPDAAAGALRDGLRASGRASLVMDDSGLGAVRALDDQAIVKRAAGLPVQLIAVVRVFPGAPSPETAVVTLYNKQGKTIAALSATSGEALAPRSQGAGQGVSSEAASAVDQVLHSEQPASAKTSASQREYQRRHVGFMKLAVISVYSAYSATLEGYWGAPYLGSREAVLDEVGFFRAVGRPDYADSYTRKRRLKRALSIPGWILMLGGSGMLISGAAGALPERCRVQNSSFDCIDGDNTANHLLLGFGVGLTAIGLSGVIAAAAIKPMPTTAVENHRLAAVHNSRLRKQLGLPAQLDDDVDEGAQKTAADTSDSPSVQVMPTMSPSHGGLSVRVNF